MSFEPLHASPIAVIDLGTNTFHLLIAGGQNGRPQILHREKQPVKLGMGGINQKLIQPEAAQRALDCLQHFRKVIASYDVKLVNALGTSALRTAQNGRELIETIRKQTGFEVKLISGDEEASYIYYGVRSAMDLGTSPSLIVDIGGGSVEFIIGDRDKILWKKSVETGAQRMLETFQRHDPITPEEISELEAHLDQCLGDVAKAIAVYKPMTLTGSSGTFDTLSEIHCIREGIPLSPSATETPLTPASFLAIHQQLITKNREARMQIPGMIEMRVDMIVVASCLVKYLLDHFHFPSIRVSTYSLKEGVLDRLYAKTRP